MESKPVVLRTAEQFKALGHPLRHRMVIMLRQRPATLAQLAAALGSTKGTVGYHVGVLQEAGLLRLAGTRRVRGGTEQYYEPVGDGLVVGADAEPGAGARVMISTALAELLPGEPAATRLRHLRITPERAAELARRLGEWAEEGTLPDDPTGLAYTLLLSLHRADIPALPPEPDR
ncbi:helix-turn-helix domain-containing protein [Allokutzneria sp. A3M-2-11 16]|uniref:winged helix-turn-helix domain-containing protein n=1 Tax=Allokutzneria sp. A3M-2-11 16 TaxID=2962043 RepID=UPI0020B8E871|nr:winged helix-turn-helix domain-containing protein [Allokutzneria sp. A3M-2-11 16]MCP3804147.1 helix-turn-helix domain-containing protein [Allokutzneria sp. A3M-2-11 16]